MARKISIISTKGGVGKTTLTANLGAALADLNQRVLLIDTDKQQSLSKYYPLEVEAQYGLKELVMTGSSADCISTTMIEGLDIIVNNDPDEYIKSWVHESPGSHIHFLSSALKSLDGFYDVILIDTVGTRGMGDMQEMAIRASDICLSPMSADWLAAKELPNTIDLLQMLEPPPGLVVGDPIPPLNVILWGVKRSRDNRLVVEDVTNDNGQLFQEYYRIANGKLNILKTVVPSVEAYNRATGQGVPIHRYEPYREGPTASGAETMKSLIDELFSHLSSTKFKPIETSKE